MQTRGYVDNWHIRYKLVSTFLYNFLMFWHVFCETKLNIDALYLLYLYFFAKITGMTSCKLIQNLNSTKIKILSNENKLDIVLSKQTLRTYFAQIGIDFHLYIQKVFIIKLNAMQWCSYFDIFELFVCFCSISQVFINLKINDKILIDLHCIIIDNKIQIYVHE